MRHLLTAMIARPLPHPRGAQPTDLLPTHHGRRLTGDQLREVITRVARDAELPHTAGHQLRQAYATSMPASARTA